MVHCWIDCNETAVRNKEAYFQRFKCSASLKDVKDEPRWGSTTEMQYD
jgi:hypothetical protein